MEKHAKKLLLKHFSHEHLLEHSRVSPPKGYSICFGCKLDILPGKKYYRCKTCPFYLHQVCYNMPQQVQHPVDPKHHLILLALPSSIDNSIDCKACQQKITGFYYNCGRCGAFFHALCLAAPLSVKLPVHPHALELEFSPPYDFQCDLCNEASYRGWLYRCGLCEFDAHISCALMDKQANEQMLPEAELLGIEGRIHADTDRKDNELMELLSRGIKCNEKYRSKENFQKQSHAQDDQEIPISEDKTTPTYQCTPSYQFSDACFSIDFAKSFLHDDQANREADFQQFQVLGSKEPRPIGYVVVPKGVVGDVMQANPTFDVSRSPSFDLHSKSAEKGQNLVISTAAGSDVKVEINQENPMNKLKASNNEAAATASKQTKKSNTVRSRCSCW